MLGYLPYHSEVKNGGYEVNSAPNYGWSSAIGEQSLKAMEAELLVSVSELIHQQGRGLS